MLCWIVSQGTRDGNRCCQRVSETEPRCRGSRAGERQRHLSEPRNRKWVSDERLRSSHMAPAPAEPRTDTATAAKGSANPNSRLSILPSRQRALPQSPGQTLPGCCKDGFHPPQSELHPQFDLIKERAEELHYTCSRPSATHPPPLFPKQPAINSFIKPCLFSLPFPSLLFLARGFTSKTNTGKPLNSSNTICF